MPASLPGLIGITPRANAEKGYAVQAKAAHGKPENGDFLAEIGAALDAARASVGWTVDRLAGELKRDPRQVSRWLNGAERTQVDVVWGVIELRKPFVIALGQRAGAVATTRLEWPEERKRA